MTVQVKLTSETRRELQQAIEWYEQQVPGLGQQLLLAVDGVLSRISEDPSLHAIVHRDLRRVLLRRFPYGVFYRYQDDGTAVVVAIVHLHRNPRRWMTR
jgi:plasmid stabilization system protein ParE